MKIIIGIIVVLLALAVPMTALDWYITGKLSWKCFVDALAYVVILSTAVAGACFGFYLLTGRM